MKNLKSFLFGEPGSVPAKLEIPLLGLRLFAGLSIALAHGINKLPPSEGFTDAVGGLGFPLPEFFAWCAALAEFLGGLFLAIGLLSRPAACFLVINMGVAFYSHLDDPFARQEFALLYFFTFLVFAFYGCGKTGVDKFLRK